MSAEERLRARKQIGDQAIKLAISSRWEEAATANSEFIRLFGDETDVLNRLGKALTELGRVTEARKSYGRALELEPGNAIARRNLDRLAGMRDAVSAQPASQLDTRLFIEDTGKSATVAMQAVDTDNAAHVDAGDLVELRVQGKAVNVHSTSGAYLGMLEPRVGLRLAKFMTAGNQYSAAVVSVDDLRVTVRETFQHPSQIGKVSFPQARVSEVRAYTRKGLLRGEDIDYVDDDEPEDDPEEWHEANEDGDGTAEVDVETEDESFD
jgi:tetratricopeptide (TPR) repeat protein